MLPDIDECTTNTHDCHQYATCTNTDGSFTCACNGGYEGDGKSCRGELLESSYFVYLGGFSVGSFFVYIGSTNLSSFSFSLLSSFDTN